jgi:hypothetical protein
VLFIVAWERAKYKRFESKNFKESFSFIGRAPWLMLFPGAALCAFSVLFNRVGDALHDLLDPHYAGSELE